MKDFDQQNISNTAWSIARLARRDHPLLDAISAAARQTLDSFGPQGISNLAWAVSTLCIRDDEPLLAAISPAAIPRMPEFDSQGLSNTAWSVASLRERDGPLLQAIAAAARDRIGEMHPQSHASLLDVFGGSGGGVGRNASAPLAACTLGLVAAFVEHGFVGSGLPVHATPRGC